MSFIRKPHSFLQVKSLCKYLTRVFFIHFQSNAFIFKIKTNTWHNQAGVSNVSAAVWKLLLSQTSEVGVNPVVCATNPLVSPAASRRHSRSTSALSTADPHGQSGDLHAQTFRPPQSLSVPPKFPILEAILPTEPACFCSCIHHPIILCSLQSSSQHFIQEDRKNGQVVFV